MSGPAQNIHNIYDPLWEHDACGIGAVVNLKGTPSHATVDSALKIVEKLEHRAGKDAAGETGDGVGLMIQVPHKLMVKAASAEGIALGGPRDYGVGMFFFPADALKRAQAQKMLEIIASKEGLDFLASRRGLLDGVVLTGGEPLLQPDAADFLRKVRELGFAVKLDTNGCDPARLAEILNQGLVDYVAMDVKNAPARYAETVGIPGFNPAPVEESIRLLRKSTVDYEFRTTLVRELHRPEDLDAIAAWLAGAPRYYLQNFVDSGNLIGRGYHGFTAEQLQGFAERVRPFFGAVELRGID